MLITISLALITLFLYLVVLNFFLGLFIIHRNPKQKINCSFALYCFALAVWMFSLFSSQYSEYNSIIWSKLSFLTQLIIIIDVWYISFLYPKKEKSLKSGALIIGSALFSVFFILLFFTPYFIDQYGSFGEGLLLFTTILWIPIAWTILNFYKKFPKTIGLEKQQLKYIFWSYIFWAVNANFLANIFNIIGNDIAYLSFCGLSSLIATSAVFYTIARYRLLDIRLLVAKAVVYSLLANVVIVVYTVSIFLIGLYIYDVQLSTVNLIVTLSLTLLATLTVAPVKKALEKMTYRAFLKDKIKQNEALADFAHLFFSSKTIKNLSYNFSLKLSKALKIEKVVFVFNKNNNLQVLPSKLQLSIEPKEYDQIIKNKQPVLAFDDLKENYTKKMFRLLRVYYAYTFVKKEYSAILFLGFKANGDIYFEDERNFLKILLPQYFIALERILSYEKLKDFNKAMATEVKEATKDLRDTNIKLKKNIKLKNEVISVVSHELTVPMIAISGSLYTLIEGMAGRISKQSKEFLLAIYNENMRLIRLTKNLLNISKIRTGRIVYELEKFNPKNLLTEVIELMTPLAAEKNLKLEIEIPNKNLKVKADRDLLKEVIINLIDNSIRYTKTGFIKVGYKEDKNIIQFFVQDTGIGMSAKKQKEIFVDIDLLNGAKRLKKKGRGLGLYICQNLLKGMAGKMTFKSKLKKGSTFTFSLPKA